MRIQTQRESFSWRFANPQLSLPSHYSEDDWARHQHTVHSIIDDLFDRRIDSRKHFGDVNPNNNKDYRPRDPKRIAQYKQVLDILRNTGGPGNFESTEGRGLAATTRNFYALLMSGAGGSGKGTLLRNKELGNLLRGGGNPFTINPDDTKVVMARLGMTPTARDLQQWYGIDYPEWDELSPMEKSPFLHEEASWLTKQFAAKELLPKGFDVIYDGTLAKQKGIDELMSQLREAGYRPENGGKVNLAGIEMPVSESYRRAQERHRHGQEQWYSKYGGDPLFSHYMPEIFGGYGAPDSGDSGGRALSAKIHEEMNPPPGSSALSASGHMFPYAQDRADSSLLINGLYKPGDMPEVLSGSGDDFRDFVPLEKFKFRLARRVFMASDQEYTVRLIVKDFENGDIDLNTMVQAIIQRIQETVDSPRHGYHDLHISDSDEVYHWLESALDRGTMSQGEFDQAMSVLEPYIFGQG